MTKKRNTINQRILNITIVWSLFSSLAFAPSDEKLSPLPPDILSEMTLIAVESDVALEYPREEFKKDVKQNHRVFAPIVAYAAIREDDISLCENLDNTEKCRDMVEDLMHIKDLAKGRCEEMSSDGKFFCLYIKNYNSFEDESSAKYLCQKFRQEGSFFTLDCDNSEVWSVLKDFYQGYNQGDLLLFQRAAASDLFCGAKEQSPQNCTWNEDGAKETLAIYQGSKFPGGKEACEKYTSGLEGHRAYLCEVMFSKSPLNEVLDNVAEDLAYFYLSDVHKDKRLCEKIKNSSLKNACFSGPIEEYFNERW